MKRISIFCDGTWNQLSAPNATHVARLARAVRPSATDGRTQLVYYQQGVGTGRGTNAVARKMDKWLGGALGWGLDDNIIEAYRNLIFWYEPGDQIFIFGFSRGAYTARSLAGLIRTAGIPLVSIWTVCRRRLISIARAAGTPIPMAKWPAPFDVHLRR